MLTALLTFLGAVSATLHIWAEYNGPQFQIYLFKPLTMIFILLIAIEKTNEMRRFYGYAIVAGLLFSLAGDIFLMLPSDQFISGLISFLVAHLFYIAAFVINRPFQLSIRSILPYAIYGILISILLLPHLGDMKFPVLAYIVVILVMGWQSWERWHAIRDRSALFAVFGAIFFIVSDTVLAIDRFRGHFALAGLMTLIPYFCAQWMIAVSIRKPRSSN
ncbi:MAG TPA: lysoplasmalogenase [Desulfobacterales bacterium]|nr:lysoplasmalogenase [Desulfobacterales bacterium]